MNDRMYELINQCFIATTEGELSQLNTVANIEKFALLIVQECAELVKDFYQEDEFTCYSAETEIKEHFGVEE